ncbi:MAG: DUF4256 domain-containing protein [Thermoleophilia bacterium]|nr:DUF4256 domain-containing protein [Thermoleophilia bacterium]
MSERNVGPLGPRQREEFLGLLKARFDGKMHRHKGFRWERLRARLDEKPDRLWALSEMDRTGGEPDVIGQDKESGEYLFVDCSAESPHGRRSVCYDHQALQKRKEHKPRGSAVEMAAAMGAVLLTEEEYRTLQALGRFDTKTSSWLHTPPDIRSRGGAIFGDYRYGTVFIYHNGADSYYAARGFRCVLRV